MISLNSNNFFKSAFIIAVLVNIIAAIYSIGYYYADEHYQLIEFAGYKLGTHTAKELAWEFAYRLRPSFQPAICYCIFKTAQHVGINDPYMQAFLLRLISAMLSLTTIVFFIKTFVDEFKDNVSKKIFIVLSFFLWFLPFLNVRFSSETWAGIFLILSLCLLKKLQFNKTITLKIFALIIIASTFLLRYQMLLPLVCMAAWFLFIDKNRAAAIIISNGIILSFAIGLFIERWFYGEWTLPLYNYASMVITGSGPDFGNEPWYYYFTSVCTKSFFPIGLLLLFSFFIFWITAHRHIITWITLPFLMLHIFLAHKELRFLFPLAMLCPFIICYVIEKIQSHISINKPIMRKSIYAILLLLLCFNFVLMTVSILIPASPGIAIAETIHKNYAPQKIILLHTPYSNPYSPFESVPVKFYEEKNVQQIKVNNATSLPDSVLISNSVLLFSLRSDDYKTNNDYLNTKNFKPIKYAIPPSLIDLNKDIWCNASENFVLLERK